MDFDREIVREKFTAYPGDAISTDLSLAIWLIDDSTGGLPIGNISVMIKEGDFKAIKNLSSYYVFTHLADKKYTVLIKSDLYILKEETVSLDPANPVKEILLEPALPIP
jgi:hypothetical protein